MIQTKQIQEKIQSEVKPFFMSIFFLCFLFVSAQTFFGSPPETFQSKNSTIGVQTMEVKAKAEELKKDETPTDPAKDKVEAKSEQELESKTNLDQEKNKSQIISRMTNFFKENKSPLTEKEAEIFYNLGKKYKIHPYAAIAVAFADSSLGKNLTTTYNLGNVGNTDSCPTCKSFKSWEQGIEAIFKTLTNKYLGNASKLCHLSQGGWDFCQEGKTVNNGKFYACSGGPIIKGVCKSRSAFPKTTPRAGSWDRNANYATSWLLGQEFNRDFNYKNF